MQPGDLVINAKDFSHLRKYFDDGAKRITRIEYGKPDYTGGAFVFVEIYGKEQGFYIKALKKV